MNTLPNPQTQQEALALRAIDQIVSQLEVISKNVTRMETRLCKLMLAHGVDPKEEKK